ncbi:MAG: hypothetical protein L3K03_05570 [Thermoplasmata archaeon]|nr:hypothetical protein [Thermoplasmata archaeon]
MSTLGPVALALIIVGVPIGIAILIYLLWKQSTGTIMRPWLLALMSVGTVALFVWSERYEVFLFPFATVVADAVLVVVGFVPAYRHMQRTVKVGPRPVGQWWYRSSISIALLWVVALVSRYGVEAATFGRVFLFTLPVRGARTDPFHADALLLLGGLLALATGLLLGQNIGIYKEYRRQRALWEETDGLHLVPSHVL